MISGTQCISFKYQLHYYCCYYYYYPKKNKTLTTRDVGEMNMNITNKNTSNRIKTCIKNAVKDQKQESLSHGDNIGRKPKAKSGT